MCGANLRRHPPEVLGQSARVTAKLQPIDLRPAATYGGSPRSDVDIDLTAAEAVEIVDVREPEVADVRGPEIEHSAVKGAA